MSGSQVATVSAVEKEAGFSPAKSFNFAACVVLCGVIGSWVYLKLGSEQGITQLPTIPNFTMATVSDPNQENWVERAQQAFASGRVYAPADNSALFFYQQMLEREPGNPEALAGIDHVTSYLVSGAESAVVNEDWVTAQEYANQVLTLDVNNRSARSVWARAKRAKRLKTLSAKAVEQVAAGRLVEPDADNALATYRSILAINPNHTIAQQGLESIAQRLTTQAQTEIFADNHARAKELIALAKEIAPKAPGIDQTEKLTAQWSDMVNDQAVKTDLVAAARALQTGQLISSDASSPGAYEYYQAVLNRDPQSEAAQSGVQLVVNSLLERAVDFAEQEQLEQAKSALSQAQAAGANPDQFMPIQDDIDFLQRRNMARAGQFDEVLPIRDLTSRKQTAPVPPRGVEDGWIELLFTVTESGDTADIFVVKTTDEELVEPALKALERWRFAPFMENGNENRKIPVRSGVRFTFQS